MNYVSCVFMCIYVYVCQQVCCIDSSGFNSIFQFKCALLAWQKLYICIAKATAAGLLTNSAHLN